MIIYYHYNHLLMIIYLYNLYNYIIIFRMETFPEFVVLTDN